MNWINIHTDTLRSEAYLGAEPVERATWLNLMAWCCSQENSGIIKGASEWSDRKWQQLCGVTKEEATLVSELYRLGTNGDLTVSLYPIDKQEEVSSKRLTAKINGKKGGRPPKENPEKPTSVILGNPEEPRLQSVKRREGKDKGIERKDKEKEIPPNPQGEVLPHGDDFAKSWTRWKKHRTEIKKPLKPTMMESQLKRLGSMSEPDAIAMIEHTIEKGWQGMVDPKASTSSIQPKPKPSPTASSYKL